MTPWNVSTSTFGASTAASSSRHETVYARIGALHWNSLPLIHGKQKESFDSTNVIYGDAYGELEQLWERRADTAFLGAGGLRPCTGCTGTPRSRHSCNRP